MKNAISTGLPLRGSLVWYWDAFNAVTNNATPDQNNGNFPPTGSVVKSDGSDASTWGYVMQWCWLIMKKTCVH